MVLHRDRGKRQLGGGLFVMIQDRNFEWRFTVDCGYRFCLNGSHGAKKNFDFSAVKLIVGKTTWKNLHS